MAEKHLNDSIVIIPTYNEKENVEAIIRAVIGLEKGFDVLIIDDGSPDGTADIVKRLMAEDYPDRLFLIQREGKLGLGTAYIRGFKWAIEERYDYIFEMDADFSHNPNDLPKLYSACHDEGNDVSIGSRYITGVNNITFEFSGEIRKFLRAYRPRGALQGVDRDPVIREIHGVVILPEPLLFL